MRKRKAHTRAAEDSDPELVPPEPKSPEEIVRHLTPVLAKGLQLPKFVEELALLIALSLLSSSACERKSPTSIVAASLYAAATLEDQRRTQTEVCRVAKMTEVTLRRMYRTLCQQMREHLPTGYVPKVPLDEALVQHQQQQQLPSSSSPPPGPNLSAIPATVTTTPAPPIQVEETLNLEGLDDSVFDFDEQGLIANYRLATEQLQQQDASVIMSLFQHYKDRLPLPPPELLSDFAAFQKYYGPMIAELMMATSPQHATSVLPQQPLTTITPVDTSRNSPILFPPSPQIPSSQQTEALLMLFDAAGFPGPWPSRSQSLSKPPSDDLEDFERAKRPAPSPVRRFQSTDSNMMLQWPERIPGVPEPFALSQELAFPTSQQVEEQLRAFVDRLTPSQTLEQT
eukprot:TRINITY_DN9871_c0_g1_i1.p1 TRINITY_DN9871_c0_g1~~TRINITY_DN9871_c0_g1_i1.p1  ORF type:complete len:421 (-),score=67.37 TRINITY_DN9871_c0_g1_i1:13-1206(-)